MRPPEISAASNVVNGDVRHTVDGLAPKPSIHGGGPATENCPYVLDYFAAGEGSLGSDQVIGNARRVRKPRRVDSCGAASERK